MLVLTRRCGEEIVIARAGRPVARLVPLKIRTQRRPLGIWKGQIWIAPDFDEPIPELLRAYRAREPWLEGRLVITPHSAWLTPESEHDTRRKSAETMRAALLTNRPQNVITPEMF